MDMDNDILMKIIESMYFKSFRQGERIIQEVSNINLGLILIFY